ncbi:hypothetical protein Poli38472_013211 [Pythium oligandrum]|uniref:UFSP1/2/DUB catalytic domain-containing protein n=1 Tax=Pythium oligandrum TaxID=41045 RepID=A0A8K1F9K7_PYTOL|nr:hypothetical protein Poli38472_013211 [Pythium oligandrum]|eukprot:TMW55320.1 hypothetical protein Poli38472_013211 [Pythium oligandrum]
MAVVIPSTLVHTLRRYGVADDAHGTFDDDASLVTHGVVLGTLSGALEAENKTSQVAVWGLVRDVDHYEQVTSYLPAGIAPVGVLAVWRRGSTAKFDDEDTERTAAIDIARASLAKSTSTTSRVALVFVHETQRFHCFQASEELTSLSLTVVESLHASDFLQATGHVLLRTALEVDEPLCLDTTELFFSFPEANAQVFSATGVDVTSSSSPSSTLVRSLVKVPEEKATKAKKAKKNNAYQVNDNWDTGSKVSKGANAQDPLAVAATDMPPYLKTLEYGEIANVELLHSLAPSSDAVLHAPFVDIPPVSSNEPAPVRKVLRIDALAVVSLDATVADAVQLLNSQVTQQARAAKPVEPHHFALTGVAFPLTLPVADGSVDASLATTLAHQFFQSATQPRFDSTKCSLVAQASYLATTDVLINVHEGIPSSGVVNGTQYLVDGFYGYYHYMQQGMNDKGWGCAYRSLQTLSSWLLLNHYTDKKPPTHKEIQRTLVQIGDKPAKFVNSREWIGSMEVGFVLDERYGVSFRSLNVSSGPQLVEHAQELKHHFETQGTPVMMGGGNLAFTLLGIDYNDSTGECAFLILDPHYTGSEDLETIQTKSMALEGYKGVPCGWRRATTLAKSFYNLCLPQRPQLSP